MAAEKKQQITFEGMARSTKSPARTRHANPMPDYLGLTEAAFEWADSYDSKDWDRLRKCIAPTLRVCVLLSSQLQGNALLRHEPG